MKRTVLVAALLLAGCLTPSPPAPPSGGAPEPSIRLGVTLSQTATGPGDVLHGNATVTNDGAVAVRHYGYCDPVIALRFLGPDGRETYVSRPMAQCEALSEETLAPGASKSVAFTFDGRVWDGDTPRPAPSGAYTVQATFRHWPDAGAPFEVPEDEMRTVEAEATWTHTASPPGGIRAGGPELSLVLDRTSFAKGEIVTLNATAVNQGERTVYVDTICAGPFRVALKDAANETIPHREGFATCMAIRLGPFEPGESLSIETTWDGRLHGDAGVTDAPPGTYTFIVTFQWWDSEDADSEIRRTEARADVAWTG